MIKLIAIRPVEGRPELDLTFSDGSYGRWSAASLIERNTILTRQLAEPTYLARAFAEGGALAWPNGLELSPSAIYARMAEANLLQKRAA